MKLSVIISTYNREDYIKQALSSFVNQDFDNNDFEIILVNNNSTDKTADICNRFQKENKGINYKYFVETKQGLSYARNRGIAEASGDIVIFIDDDAFAFKDYLKETVLFFDNNPDIIAGGGRIYPKWESEKPAWMSKYLMPLVSVIDLGDEIQLFKNRNFPVGANMAFRKDAFLKYGNFNTKLGRKGKGMQGGEEKDIFYRLQSAGEKVAYIPAAKVYHLIPDKRLTPDFIQNQALGIGQSEIIRAKNINKLEVLKSIFRELLKWGASCVLFFIYIVQLKFAKAIMLIKFRYWASRGMLLS